jgi:hypothetical protein
MYQILVCKIGQVVDYVYICMCQILVYESGKVVDYVYVYTYMYQILVC